MDKQEIIERLNKQIENFREQSSQFSYAPATQERINNYITGLEIAKKLI